MNKTALGGVAASIVLAGFFVCGQAAATNLPYKASATSQAAYNWTGCYLGAQIGGGTQSDSFTTGFIDDDRTGQSGLGGGALAGGQIGCNYQIGVMVFGVEGEAAWSGLTNKLDTTQQRFLEEFKARNRWSADVAARVGVAVDRTLIYGKAGVAQGSYDFSFSDPFGDTSNASGILTGLLFGAGIEYAFAPNWSAKLEYDHIDYVSRILSFSANPPPGFAEGRSASVNLVKAGINYRFGGADLAPPLEWQARTPVYKAPPAASYSWSGCYAGAAAGAGVHNDPFSAGENGVGGLGGGQIGCNYQTGQIVFGVEGEAAWSGLSGKFDFTLPLPASESAARNRWTADVAARAGVAFDRALIYSKVGVAEGSFVFSGSDTTGFFEQASGNLTGLLLGAGVEYTFAPNWSAKLEYDHIDYVSRILHFTQRPGLPADFNANELASANLVKAGINYRFAGPDRSWAAGSPRPVSSASYNWTGCYAGAHGGAGVLKDSYAVSAGGGALAGGQVGCNYQIGQIVLGLEGEATWSALSDKLQFMNSGFASDFAGRNRWSADVAARAGVAIDRALIYSKLGVAEGGFAFSGGDTTGFFQQAGGNLSGLLLGGGIEYGFAANWSAKLEYDHIDYVSRALQVSRFQNGAMLRSFETGESASVNAVKAGINYRFVAGDVVSVKN